MGFNTVTNDWENWSAEVWNPSHWEGNEEARDALRAAVEAATLRLSDPAAKVAKAKSILSGIGTGLGLIKAFLPL